MLKPIQNENILEIKVPTIAEEPGDFGSGFDPINAYVNLARFVNSVRTKYYSQKYETYGVSSDDVTDYRQELSPQIIL